MSEEQQTARPPLQSPGVAQIVDQQLQLMSQQLDLLRALPSPAAHVRQSHEPARAAPVVPEQSIRESVLSLRLDPEVFVPYRPRKVESIQGLSERQHQHIQQLLQRFEQRTRRSKELAQRSRVHLADSRGTAGFNFTLKEIVYPLVVQRAREAHVWDIDGNEYIDLAMGFGALLFGHTPAFLLDGLGEQLKEGMRLGWQSDQVGRAARLLCELTGAERACFCNSGTEAVMTALRLARAVTGRAKVVVFAGAFHGTFDGILVQGEQTAEQHLRTRPLAPGIPEHMIEDVIMVHFGSEQALATIKAHANELAAVLVELPQSRRPDLVPGQFLFALRQLTSEAGVALIFDEVVAGFRMHPGGAQALVEVQADIVTYGKALGAGLPVAAVAGKAAYLDAIDGGMWNYGDRSYPQAIQTFYAGTHFRHPLWMPVIANILEYLKEQGPQLQEQLNQRTARLTAELDQIFLQADLQVAMSSFGSLFRFVFPSAYTAVTANIFFYHLLEKGIYIPETRGCFLSTAHTDEDIARVTQAVRASIEELQAGGFFARSSSSSYPQEPRAQAGDVFALLAQQKELWVVSQLAPQAAQIYHESLQLSLHGPLQPAALRQAVQALPVRHEALRTTFHPGGEVQQVQAAGELAVGYSDLSELAPHLQEQQLAALCEQEAYAPFDLARGPLMRAHLVRLGAQEHRCFLTFHHLAADGWSVSILLHELQEFYRAFCTGTPVQLPAAMQYRAYAHWQGQQTQALARAQSYWLARFARGVPTMQLPADYPPLAHKTFRGAQQTVQLSRELYAGLKRLSAEQNCTLFSLLLAAYSLLLAHLCGRKDLLIFLPSAGQIFAEAETLVGHCVNTLPLHVPVERGLSVQAYLRTIQRLLLDAYPHQLYPLSSLLQALPLTRDAHGLPLGGVLLNLDQLDELSFVGLRASIQKNQTAAANLDLALHVLQTPENLSLECSYASDLFAPTTIRRWLGYFERILQAFCARPQQRLLDLVLLSTQERQQLLVEWNASERTYPQDQQAQTLFAASARAHPERIALVFAEHSLTYGQLDRQSNQLAHYLRQLGVGPETRVGVCMQRSLTLVIGLLGILKAGGAHVSLDPDYPQERLRRIAADAGVPLVLTQQHLQAHFAAGSARVLCLDTAWPEIAGQGTEACANLVGPEHAAYVLYTSGSTGQPKGVVIEHRSLSNLLHWKQEAYGLTCKDRMLLDTALSFDTFVYQTYLPLLCGSTLVVVPAGKEGDAAYMAELVQRQQITYMSFVPAILHIFVEEGVLDNCQSLRVLSCGGEVMSEQIFRYFAARPGRALWNMYGPTETTIHATAWLLGSGEMRQRPPIGRPVANAQIYLLDAYLQPVPAGVPGELYVGGAGLARGYLHQPALTAEKFLPNPFSPHPGERLYRTGDLACSLPDGNLHFLGRRDQQVKVRGVRIETGEIEAVLRQHPQVSDAAVLLRPDLPAENNLLAYLSSPSASSLSGQQMRDWLRARLPESMQPAGYIILAHWPLLPSGKLDQQTLLHLPYEHNDAALPLVQARSPLEKALARIWCELLKRERVSVLSNFFALGGHSLLAMRVLARLRTELEIDVPLRTLFSYPTIASLAEHLTGEQQAQARPALPGATSPDGRYPLSFAQQRFWVLYQLEPQSPFYTIPILLQLNGQLQIPALEQGLSEIVRRHEILRTIFVVQDGQLLQQVQAPQAITLGGPHLCTLDAPGDEPAIQQALRAQALQPFDLERGPLLRCSLLRLDQQSHILVLAAHHSVFDGWSAGILLHELAVLYTAYLQGQPSPLPALAVQYKEYALWQRQWLVGAPLERLLGYWQRQLAGAPQVLELPTDRPHPALQSFRGAILPWAFNPPVSQGLRACGSRQGVTLFMTLLAAFAVLLARYSGQEDLLIGTPVASRAQLELEQVIGVFLNTLALRVRLPASATFDGLLAQVRETVLEAYAHQDLPFEKLVDSLHLKRDLRYNALCQVMLMVDAAGEEPPAMPGLSIQRRDIGGAIAKFDLSLSLTDTGEEIAGVWEYSTDLFDEATIARLTAHFQILCRELLAHPGRPVASLPLHSEQDLLEVRAATRARTLTELFEAHVQATPQALALLFEDEHLTYGELERRANQLAHHLRTLGVGPETPVGLGMERSSALVIALLAVLKAGGCYVPLDPLLPARRLAAMLTTAGARVLITQRRLLGRLPSSPARLLVLDEQWPQLAHSPTTPLVSVVQPENAAYILSTSGSTGQPKGVCVTQRSVLNLLICLAERLAITARDQFLALTSLSFDIAGLEILLPLLVGARVRMVSREVASQGNLLLEVLQTSGASVVQATPATWRLLLAAGWQGSPGLKALCGGEALSRELATRLQSRCALLWNLYGPTETTIWSTCWPVPPHSERISLGQPVDNTGICLLNAFLQPVPYGVAGQLCIAGDGLARGYVGQPDLTAASFLPHPFAQTPGARLYLTGDRARLCPDGTLEFLGRLDHQLKLRGFRIELGEIEAALRAISGVRDCVVTAHESASGSSQLVAYVVPEGKLPEQGVLHKALAARLPEYMLPTLFVPLPALPLTSGGKIDRRALPTPPQQRTEAGAVQILQVWDARQSAAADCLPEAFARQVQRTPEAIAVLDGERQLSYYELDRRATQLAHRLRQLGVGPEVLVGVCLQRSLEMLLALLALWKAGGVYLPLSPAYPARRLSLLIEQARIPVVLTSQPYVERLSAQGGPQLLCLSSDWSAFADEPETPCVSGVRPENLAYVIYTSGSTGLPKGAMVEQRGMLNHLFAKIGALHLGASDIVAQNAAQSFDISVWQLLAALLVGGRVQIIDDEIGRDPLALVQTVERCQVTVLETVPSLLQGLAQLAGQQLTELPPLAGLRWLISTGEALWPRIARFWLTRYPAVGLMNGYGPTECSDDVSHYVLSSLPEEGEAALPIGRAIAQIELHVLGADLAAVPGGTAGELFVSGIGVGRGYLYDPARTAEAFLPNPYGRVPGERLYRTGDLVCVLPDGNLEFLGRQDSQVKLRGSRIELHEIEAVLNLHAAVGQSVVLLREGQGGRGELAAYIVPQAGMQVEAHELYQLLKTHLPEAMLPAAFVLLSALPVNSHGKTDRQALLALSVERAETGQALTTAGTPKERILQDIWSQVLAISQVGIHDNFFELGGDSIVGMLMVLKAREAGLELASRQLFQYQTIAELARHATLAPPTRPLVEAAVGTAPLTPIQEWFFARELPARHHWNQSVLLELREPVEHALLQECLRQIVRTHHALRLRFTPGPQGWQQSYGEQETPFSLRLCDLRAYPARVREEMLSQLADEAQASLTLSEGLLLRALLFDVGESQPARLFLCVHHLAIDIVSWQILLADLQTLYRQGQQALPLQLPPATTSYLAWARQLLVLAGTTRLRQEAAFWLAHPWEGVRALPTDTTQGQQTEASTRALVASLPPRETRILLREVPKLRRAQVSEILLAALALVLGRWTGHRVQLIEVEGHGREDILPGIDLSRTVGWFTSLVPLCLRLPEGTLWGSQAFAEALGIVKERLRAWPDGGIGYGLLRYMHSDQSLREQCARLPQAEVVFNYEGQSAGVSGDELLGASADLALRDRASANLRPHLLSFNLGMREDCLQIEVGYSEQRHTEATIQHLLQAYLEVLRACLERGQPTPAGYVPSDFPAARLTQEQLTRLLVTLEQQEEQDGNEDE